MTLPELLVEGWTIEFSDSGSHVFPILCRATRVIAQLAPDRHRRSLGSAAGTTPTQALTRALALAETNEAETVQIFINNTYAQRQGSVDLLSLLNLTAPPLAVPSQKVRRI